MSKFFKSMFLLLTAGLFTATGWAQETVPLAEDLQQYYSFDIDNNVSRGTQVALGGTYKQATTNPFGKGFGAALGVGAKFNRVDSNFIPGTNDFTCMLRFATTTAGVDATKGKYIISRGATVWGVNDAARYTPGWSIKIGSDGKLTLNVGVGSTLYTITTDNAIYGDTLQAKHLAWTRNGTTITLYVNGVSVGTTTLLEANASISLTTDCWRRELSLNSYPWESSASALGTNDVLDELAFWGRALSDTEIKSIADSTASLDDLLSTSLVVRTLTAAEEIWEDAEWGEQGTEAAPTGGEVKLLSVVEGGTKLKVGVSQVNLDKLTINGDKPLTITLNGSNKLMATTTTISTDTTVEAGAASLGAVAIAKGKTLTVKENYFSNNDNISNGTKLLGPGSIALDLGTGNGLTLYGNGADTFSGAVNVLSGNLRITGAGGSGFLTGRTVNVLDGAAVTIGGDNATGHGNTPENSILHIQQGGTVDFSARNSFKSTLKLTGGTVNLTGGDNAVDGIKRTLDWMSNGDYLQAEALTGATAETPTVSTISQTNGCGLALRSALGIVVEEKAKLVIDASIVDVGNGAVVTKKGLGVLELAGQNTSSNDLTVKAGQMILSGAWAGALSVNAEAMLTYTTSATPTNAITNNGTIAADGKNVVVNLTGATLSGSGTYAVTDGATLILKKAQAAAGVTVAADATLKVKVDSYEAVDLTTTVTLDGRNNVVFVLPSGKEVIGTGATMPEQAVYTYTATAGTENNWSTVANWQLNGVAVDAVPSGTVETPVKVVLTGATTLTMDVAGVTLSALSVSGGDLTIAGENALTVKTVATATANKVVVSGALILDAPGTEAAPTKMANVFEVAAGGTLTTRGYLNLTAANQVNSSGMLEVASGVTTLAAGNRKIKGTITINAKAKLVAASTDALDYDNESVINIYGTLNMSNKRWTVFNGNVFNLYAGGCIIGDGESGRTALEVCENNTVNILANGDETTVTISTPMRSRDVEDVITFDVANGLTCTYDGRFDGNGKIKAAGTGVLKLTTQNANAGGTEIAAGATVVLGNANALGSVANITGGGTIESARLPACNLTDPGWTGTLRLTAGCSSGTEMNWSTYGNENSTFEIPKGVAIIGHFNNDSWSLAAKVTLEGDVTIDNGYTGSNGNTYTFTGPLSGSGTFSLTTANATIAVLLQDVTDFTGTLSTSTVKKTFIVGTGHPYTSSNDGGKIVIAGTLTSDAVGSWTADYGIVVEGTLTISLTEEEAAKSTFSAPITVASGATLTLNNTVATTLAGALDGSGAITLGGTGVVKVTAANEDYNGTITINSGATLTNADSSASVPFGKGEIVNNGTVKLMGTAGNAGGGQLPPTSGSGNITFCAGSTSRIPGEITTTGTVTFEGTTEETAAAVVTFIKNATDFDGKVASISGANVVVGSGVTLAKDEASKPLITIANGKTLSGGGTIKVPVTFAGTAKILIGTKDVYPTILGKITLPETNKIRVDLPSATRFLAVAKDSGLTLENFALVNETPALTDHHLSSTDPSSAQVIFSLVKKTALPSGVKTEEFDDAVTAALALWESYGIRVSEITQISPATSSGTKVEDGSRSIDAAALFTNVLSIVPAAPDFETTATAEVSYDFGVSDITVKSAQLPGDNAAQLYVLVCAKVSNGNNDDASAADYVKDTTVSLWLNDKVCDGAEGNGPKATELTDGQLTALNLSRGKGKRWLAVPMKGLFPDNAPTGTRSLKVKATK